MAFEYSRKVFYYETDKMGIAHHSNYIRWFEEARLQFLQDIGLSFERLEELGIASPVLKIECEYKSMIRFGDAFVISLRIASYDGVKLAVTYSVLDQKTRCLRAKGTSLHCFLADNKVVSLKRSFQDIHDILSKYAEAEN